MIASGVLGSLVSFRFVFYWCGVVWYTWCVSLPGIVYFFLGDIACFYCVNVVVASFCQSEPYISAGVQLIGLCYYTCFSSPSCASLLGFRC